MLKSYWIILCHDTDCVKLARAARNTPVSVLVRVNKVFHSSNIDWFTLSMLSICCRYINQPVFHGRYFCSVVILRYFPNHSPSTFESSISSQKPVIFFCLAKFVYHVFWAWFSGLGKWNLFVRVGIFKFEHLSLESVRFSASFANIFITLIRV